MVQDSDEADPETGELAWTEEKEDGDNGEDEKVYIGKVSARCGHWREAVGADELLAGSNHAAVSLLHSGRARGEGRAGVERVPLRQGEQARRLGI